MSVDSGVLRQLTPQQLQALDKATAGKRDAVSRAVQDAIAQEQRRRAEEERKKQEEERRRKCQQDGSNDCPAK